MNKLFDNFEINPASAVLAVVGAFIGFFTASGGFMSSGFNPGAFVKIASALGGAVIGFVWGSMME